MGRSDGARRVHEIMRRIRMAIRGFDPSYRLKVNGHICAKEWREIMFGARGDYRFFLLDTKADDVRDAVKCEELLRKRFDEKAARYQMDDLAVISELMRAGNRRKKQFLKCKNS